MPMLVVVEVEICRLLTGKFRARSRAVMPHPLATTSVACYLHVSMDVPYLCEV